MSPEKRIRQILPKNDLRDLAPFLEEAFGIGSRDLQNCINRKELLARLEVDGKERPDIDISEYVGSLPPDTFSLWLGNELEFSAPPSLLHPAEFHRLSKLEDVLRGGFLAPLLVPLHDLVPEPYLINRHDLVLQWAKLNAEARIEAEQEAAERRATFLELMSQPDDEEDREPEPDDPDTVSSEASVASRGSGMLALMSSPHQQILEPLLNKWRADLTARTGSFGLYVNDADLQTFNQLLLSDRSKVLSAPSKGSGVSLKLDPESLKEAKAFIIKEWPDGSATPRPTLEELELRAIKAGLYGMREPLRIALEQIKHERGIRTGRGRPHGSKTRAKSPK